jgi:hypothetical protein
VHSEVKYSATSTPGSNEPKNRNSKERARGVRGLVVAAAMLIAAVAVVAVSQFGASTANSLPRAGDITWGSAPTDNENTP